MKRFIFPLAVALCFLTLASQHSTVLAKDTWVSVRTKNFFMIGNANEKEIQKVAVKLEQFREVFTRRLPEHEIQLAGSDHCGRVQERQLLRGHSNRAQTPPAIFSLARTSTTSPLPPNSRARRIRSTIIFHEYTHLLVNNTFENAPVWFNEGLAEYYSTFSITDDQKVGIGSHIGNHVYLLRESKMLPLRTLFEVDHKSPYYNERNKQSIFYAQSWALMHYLIIGKEGRV